MIDGVECICTTERIRLALLHAFNLTCDTLDKKLLAVGLGHSRDVSQFLGSVVNQNNITYFQNSMFVCTLPFVFQV